jgi:hypothetical protein
MDPRILRIKTTDDMLTILREKGRPLSTFHAGNTIHVWNKMNKGYTYQLQEEPGQGLDSALQVYADPGTMLSLGVFEGKYLNDCILEFPAEWFLHAIALEKLRPTGPTVDVNFFQADSRQPLSEWKRKGWVPGGPKKNILSDPTKNPDERGWFQWYCRYWMGRRLPELDAVQIARWRAFSRHAGQIKANCRRGDLKCRPRQRQALLQWAWNPFI